MVNIRAVAQEWRDEASKVEQLGEAGRLVAKTYRTCADVLDRQLMVLPDLCACTPRHCSVTYSANCPNELHAQRARSGWEYGAF